MVEHEITRDEIIVMGNKSLPVFCVAVVALNQKNRQTGDIKEWLHEALPLELANEFAQSEGQKRGLPVTIWADLGGNQA